MHLVSDRRQRVTLSQATIHFAAGESICTEYSYKYNPEEIRLLCESAGFRVDHVWTDARQYFSVLFLV